MSRAFARLVAVLIVLSGIAAAAPVGEIAPLLQRALDAPAQADADVLPVWVHFRDKGQQGAALTRAVAAAEAGLTDRARARRAKMQPAGARLADARDLPLHEPYVDAVAALGAAPRTRSRWANAASFDVPRDRIAALAALPCVRKLDLVRRTRRAPDGLGAVEPPRRPAAKRAAEVPDPGELLDELDQSNVLPVHAEGWSGAGVLVGMLDSGFRTTHDAFAALDVVATYDFINDDPVVDNEAGDPATAHNHGTYTWSNVGANLPGVLVGPAFGAGYALAKTEDIAGEYPQEEDFWVAGMEWLEALGADVMNSSLGYFDWYVFADLDGDTAVTTRAADRAAELGVVVVASAGNERASAWGHIIAPADGDSVIAVGAVDAAGDVTFFSSPGPTADGRIKPDVVARGALNSCASPVDDQSVVRVSGTSISAPLVSGVAALILERHPSLTPVQVREALRETASRTTIGPNNDEGWGRIDAHAAVHYFGPDFQHTPLADTEDTASPVVVTCRLTGRDPLVPGTAQLRWRVDGGAWQSAPLIVTAAPVHQAEIPALPAGGQVEYYLTATDVLGLTGNEPGAGAAAPHAFAVGPDLAPPRIVHDPLPDIPFGAWPPLLRVTALDNIGVATVSVAWSVDGVDQADFPLASQGGGLYLGYFPDPSPALQPGAAVAYTVTAVDVSAAANAAVDGPHAFGIPDAPGRVLLVDVDGSIPIAALASADLIEGWLTGAGYLLTRENPDQVTASDLDGVQVLVLAGGGNISPTVILTLRELILDWTGDGGRLLVEGGQVVGQLLGVTGDAEFVGGALHVDAWLMDLGGDLQTASGQAGHPVLTTPHALPSTLGLSPASYADQDVVTPRGDAVALLAAATFPAGACLVAYDGGAGPGAARALTMTFNVAALDDTSQARRLVQNAVAWLAEPAVPSTAAPQAPELRTALASVSPNPFNPRTEVAFRLAAPAAARLTVFDLRGRMVRELLDGRELAAGRHAAVWDGRDARGRHAPAGLYLVRLRAGAVDDHRKLTLAR